MKEKWSVSPPPPVQAVPPGRRRPLSPLAVSQDPIASLPILTRQTPMKAARSLLTVPRMVAELFVLSVSLRSSPFTQCLVVEGQGWGAGPGGRGGSILIDQQYWET